MVYMKELSKVPLWSLSTPAVLDSLDANEQKGLSSEQVTVLRARDGRNQVVKKTSHGSFYIFLRQFQSPLIFILIFAVLATVLLAEYLDAFIITLAILTNAGLGFYQEFKAERTIQQLQSFISVRTRVIRDGREQEVDAHDVVLGDIVHLTTGSRVPADGRLLKVMGLQVDEAILTGESLPEQKSIEIIPEDTILADRTNMVYGGTLVTEGSGLFVVTAVGMKTEFGQIARLVLDTEQEKTPIQKAVHHLAWIIAGAILFIVIGVFALGISRGETIFDMFMISVAVAVGAIPEALPIGLTAVLAVGVERLAKRKGVMRSLAAAETLGSTTVIVTDKTGTLTEAKLELVDILPTQSLLAENVASGQSLSEALTPEQRDVLYATLFATDVGIENEEDGSRYWRLVGNPLETTIVRVAGNYGLPIKQRLKRVSVIGFNSKNKFSVSAAPLRFTSDITGQRFGYAEVVMGAPDIVLKRSAIDSPSRLKIQKQLEDLSYDGKRILGVALRYVPENKASDSINSDEVQGLTFLGVLAFVDPVRASVPTAVQAIENYGVRVLIATGDLAGTAVAVAKELGWSVSPEEVITGSELAELTDEELTKRVKTLEVCARVTPADKLRIAQCLQAQGEVVAMTGDGVNDAPSLKAVDIGIAVGSGSDVAKGVSDLILLDDNFGTIVAAIEEGKRVLANIRKTFVYLMSNSLDEVVLISGSLIVGLALPLSAMQIIWVNFFTGSLPAIAYAFDNQIHTRTTNSRMREKILSRQIKVLVILIGVSVSLLLFTLYYVLAQTALPVHYVQTFIFACFSMYILFIAFSLRNLTRPIFTYNPFGNSFLNMGVTVGVLLTLTTIYLPFMQGIFGTTALPFMWWWGVGVWLVFTIMLVESCKLVTARFLVEN